VDRNHLFELVESQPGRLCGSADAQWMTWSAAFRSFIAEYRDEFAALPSPRLTSIPELKVYNRTYSLSHSKFTKPLAERLTLFASALFESTTEPRLTFLTQLFDDTIDGALIHKLFALFRDALSTLCADPRQALYAPLGSTGRSEGCFPLHADLYVPEMLFNIFDEVPVDNSGASTFLSARVLTEMLAEIPNVPPEIHAEVCDLLEDPLPSDSYTKFFNILHGRKNPWSTTLERRMESERLEIKLFAGEGYIINDRGWLHGRTAPLGGVSSRRVHRLVYNTRALNSKRGRMASKVS